jgi:hypothetical protein
MRIFQILLICSLCLSHKTCGKELNDSKKIEKFEKHVLFVEHLQDAYEKIVEDIAQDPRAGLTAVILKVQIHPASLLSHLPSIS